MATVPYVTRQEVREEAGFQHVEENGSLTGVIDGSNKVFMAEHKPIVDRNYDEVTNAEDVTAYVDGSPVPVNLIDFESGVITLVDAPAEDVTLSMFYHHSQLTDFYIDQLIKQATGIVHRCLRSHGITIPFDSESETQGVYYPTIQFIVKLYAAGMALTRDYGSSADTEETSKDGYKKMSTAKSELMSLCDALIADPLIPNNGGDGNGGEVVVTSKGTVFDDPLSSMEGGERSGFDINGGSPHESFFRKR